MMATMMTETFDPDFASPSEYAKFYRSMGLQVVPAHEPREGVSWKRPALKTWREYESSLAPDEIFSLWYGEQGQHVGRLNMGLLTGRASGGTFVVDLDTHNHSDAALWWECVQDLQERAGELETATQTTGGGGKQLLFRAPPGWTPPTCKTPIGVDIRGEGGFAVLPPSKHISGRSYAWDDGLEPWEAGITVAPAWLCREIDKLTETYGAAKSYVEGDGDFAGGQVVKTPTPASALNPFGLIEDGREAYMTKVVWAAVVDEYRECPIKPAGADAQQIMKRAFETYERNTKSRLRDPGVPNHILLEREGRGITAFRQKWDAAMRQWEGKVARHAAMEVVRERPQPPGGQQGSPPHHAPGSPQNLDDDEDGFAAAPVQMLEVLNVRDIMRLPNPKYLIDGVVIDESLGFIFGPPGCGKSFIAINMALAIATEQKTWWGREIMKSGPVLYISSEGASDMKFRLRAWSRSHRLDIEDAPFFLVKQSLNFMAEGDVAMLLRTVEALSRQIGQPPVCIFVDTVSRVLPGADENLQKDMTLFIKACDALREAFKATVIGVHHTSRAGGAMRGSSVFDGAGDCLLQIEREEGSMEGVMVARKIKSAPDGWKQDFVLEPVHTGDIMGTMSLYARGVNCPSEDGDDEGFGGRAQIKMGGEKWPEKDVCNRILYAMQAAWNEGDPWRTAVQNKLDSRYAYGIMSRDFGVSATMAQRMFEEWAANGVICRELYNKRDKKYGLKVLMIP